MPPFPNDLPGQVIWVLMSEMRVPTPPVDDKVKLGKDGLGFDKATLENNITFKLNEYIIDKKKGDELSGDAVFACDTIHDLIVLVQDNI